MTKNIKWKQLLPALMLPLALGGLSAWLNRGAMADYAVLNKPPLSPPGWLFPVVWTLLFLLMGLAAYLVAVSPVSGSRRERALRLYLVQLGFCFFWGSLFWGPGSRPLSGCCSCWGWRWSAACFSGISTAGPGRCCCPICCGCFSPLI